MPSQSDYTMELRLCDDDGIVSHEPVDEPGGTLDGSYLERLNRLRNMTLRARGDKPETITEPFTCTGSAHLAGEHMRCTSPAHAAPDYSAVDAAIISGDPIVIDGKTYYVVEG